MDIVGAAWSGEFTLLDIELSELKRILKEIKIRMKVLRKIIWQDFRRYMQNLMKLRKT